MSKKNLLADAEWERYSQSLTGVKPVAFIISPDDSLGSDGYAITSCDTSTTVTSPTMRGLLYGAYTIIDACRQAGGRFIPLNTRETPDYALRMLWSWARLDNTCRHSPFMALPSLLSHVNISNPEANDEVMRFVRHMASMRVNALTLTYELHLNELMSQDQHIYRSFYTQLDKFSRFLKEWGVGLYLYANGTPEKDFLRINGETDCPFDPVVRRFLEEFVIEICEELPELEGLLIAGSLGRCTSGRLYLCDCQYCRGKAPIQRVEEQIRVIANMLKRFNKQMVYDVSTDRPDILYRELEVILGLTNNLPDNVIMSFRNHFQDFEELRYPEHPLFSRLEEKFSCGNGLPKQNSLPVAAIMQLFCEMRGKGLILSNVTDIWSDEIARLHTLGAKGIVGVVETHPDDAHPSMAEWYAWGRLAWNSGQSSHKLLAEWTKMNYPAGVDAILPDLLRSSYMAASNTIYAGGLQCGAHGMLCISPEFLKHLVNETWFRTDKPAPFDVIGVDDEPIDLWTDKRCNEILHNPRMLLLTKAYNITLELYDRLMWEKDAAVAQYKALLAQWRTAYPLFDPGDYRYHALCDMLEKNVEDARRFRACLSLFWRYHMGLLTECDIIKAQAELLGPHGLCSISTCDEAVAIFLDRLRMSLLKTPFDTCYNNMLDFPQITVPGWEARNIYGKIL